MRKIFDIPLGEIRPTLQEVLERVGLPEEERLSAKHRALLESAERLYCELVSARGIIASIPGPRFAELYRGEGRNAEKTPLELIAPRAQSLALFAATLGGPLCEKITSLFNEGDPATGFALDAMASVAADQCSSWLASAFLREEDSAPVHPVLPYSPGYCGWDLTGQRKLFEALKPGEIGITLNESCLMQPLKSVSGVLVRGTGEIHKFRNDFDFCEPCKSRDCRQRLRAVLAG